MSAIIEYQWIKVYREGNVEKFIPQFTSEGKQQFWNDTKDINIHKLVISPISPEVAAAMQNNGIPGCSVPLPVWNFSILPNDDIKAYWDNEIQLTNHFYCKTCGHQWKHLDSSKWAECPRCGQKDEWSCKRCGKHNIDNSVVKRNARGETNCPYCEIPYGLNRTRYLERIQDIIENTDYVIELAGKFKIIIRKDCIDVESLQPKIILEDNNNDPDIEFKEHDHL